MTPTPISAADHLEPDRLRQLAAGAEPAGVVEQAHLDGCEGCYEALAADRLLTVAARSVDALEHGRMVVPAFAAMLQQPGFAEVRRHVPPVIETVSASQRATGRLSAQILLAQLRFLSPWLAAAAVAWTGLSGLASLTVRDPEWAARLTAAALSLLLMLAAAWATENGSPARFELLQSLPISPRLTYLFRLTGTLMLVLVLGLVVSAVGMTRDGPLISLWLGPGLLAASAAAVVGVRWNVTAGQTVGVLMWLLGSVSRLPSRVGDAGLAAAVHAHWFSSPLAIALALALFVMAVQAVPGRSRFSLRA